MNMINNITINHVYAYIHTHIYIRIIIIIIIRCSTGMDHGNKKVNEMNKPQIQIWPKIQIFWRKKSHGYPKHIHKYKHIYQNGHLELTESIFDEVIEGVAIAIVGELVVGSRELLEALGGDAGEIPGELRELGQDHRPSSHEAVDQRLLPHLSLSPLRRKKFKTLTLTQIKIRVDSRGRGRRFGGSQKKIAGFAFAEPYQCYTPQFYIINLLFYIYIYMREERDRERKGGWVYLWGLK